MEYGDLNYESNLSHISYRYTQTYPNFTLKYNNIINNNNNDDIH